MWEAKTSKCRVSVREGLGQVFVGRDKFVHCVVLLDGSVREVAIRLACLASVAAWLAKARSP